MIEGKISAGDDKGWETENERRFEVTWIVEEDTVGRYDIVADEEETATPKCLAITRSKHDKKQENEDKERVAYDTAWYSRRVNTIL